MRIAVDKAKAGFRVTVYVTTRPDGKPISEVAIADGTDATVAQAATWCIRCLDRNLGEATDLLAGLGALAEMVKP